MTLHTATLHKPGFTERWAIFMITLALAGYAFLGRGFAYVGLPPLFIGEVTLAVGLVAALAAGRFADVLKPAASRLLLFFMAFGLVRLAVDLPVWGVDALRDAVIWGYGSFAFIVGALVLRDPERLRLFFARYRRFVVGFVLLAGVLYVGANWNEALVPIVPGTDGMPLIGLKGGDTMVHLAGATAFLMVGLARWRWWLFLALGADLTFLAITNRGGMVAFAVACGLVLVLQSRRVHVAAALYAAALIIVVFVLVDPRIKLPGGREVSIEQYTENITSVVQPSGNRSLNGTREWRLSWWKKIVGYTFGGRYFLTGKGFGINLANDDGFQVSSRDRLRSPHNGHLTVLARMGVPGFLLWMAVQAAWALAVLRAMLTARRRGEDAWHGIFLFLMAYWLAFLVNASFDVFLEGPMGGIWFWCVFGLGLATTQLYARFERTGSTATWGAAS